MFQHSHKKRKDCTAILALSVFYEYVSNHKIDKCWASGDLLFLIKSIISDGLY